MKAFVLDVDGTLADTEELHRDAFNEAFGEAGLSWHWDQYRYEGLLAVGGGRERIARFIEDEGIVPSNETRDDLSHRLHAAKTRLFTAAVERSGIELRPGVAELIAAARRRGVRLAIATTTSRQNVDALLSATLGSAEDFEAIGCGDMVAEKKPAPDIYRLVLDALALAPHECLAFEDSVNGLEAAKAAGLRCVVTPSLYTRSHDFAGADLVLDDLTDRQRLFAFAGL